MKKLILILTILSMLIISCGGEKKADSKTEKEVKKETKKLSLETEEGIKARIGKYGVILPSELKFVEVKKKSGEFSAKFEITDADSTVVAKIDSWFKETTEGMKESGWKQLLERDNEKMMGNLINEKLLMKGNDTINLTTVYDPKNNNYKVYVQP